MTKSSVLKLSLLGAFLSLGAFAKNDVQAKHLKDRDDFVEKAAMISKQQVTLSELAISQSTNPAVKQFAERVIKDHQKSFDSLKSIAATKGISLPFASIGSGITSTSGSEKTGSTKTGSGSSDLNPYPEPGATNAADDIKGDVKAAGEEVKSAGEEVASDTKKAANDVAGTYPQVASTKEYEKENKKLQEKYDDLTKLSGEKFDKAYLSDINSNNDKAISFIQKEAKDGWDTDVMTWANETLPSLRNHKEMAKMVKQDIKSAKPSM